MRQDLDRERVAGLGSFDKHRPGQRVDAVPVELGDASAVDSGVIWPSLTSRVS